MSLNNSAYTLQLLRGEDGLLTLEPVWRKLWAECGEAAEQAWDWQYLYWKHLANRTCPIIVAAKDPGGSYVALAAFVRCRDRRSRVSKACFLGDHYADYHMILARPGLSECLGARMLDAVVAEFGRRTALVQLSHIRQDSWMGKVALAFSRARGERGALVCCSSGETYAVPLPATIKEYLERLGERTRRNCQYERRRLAKDFSLDLRICTTPERLDEALEAVETVHRARWGAKSCYKLPRERAFHRAVARAFSEMGIYRAFVLYLDGRPAAYVVGTLVGNSLAIPSMAYDPGVPGKYSIGKAVNFYAIEYAIQAGYTGYDLTRGSEDYKKWLGGERRLNLDVSLYRSRLDLLSERWGKVLVGYLRDRTPLGRLMRVRAERASV